MSLILPTEKELADIKNGVRETINNFYFKNYEDFKRISYSYCRSCRCYYLLGDCVNQIYIDLQRYNFTTLQSFINCVRRSCKRAGMFSATTCYLLDEPVNEDGTTIGELIASDIPTALEYLEYTETLKETAAEVLKTITDIISKSKKKKVRQELDTLCGYVFPTLTDEEIKALAGV